MTRFGKGDGVIHGFAVTDFTDKDDIGCLAQRVFQRRHPVFRIYTNLTLSDDAVLMVVDKLNRILDSDDVPERVFVAVIDKRGERSRFPRAGTADKNHKAAFFQRNILQDRRQVQTLKLGNFAGNCAEYQCRRAALYHRINAETAGIRQADGKVALVGR